MDNFGTDFTDDTIDSDLDEDSTDMPDLHFTAKPRPQMLSGEIDD